jgi:pSer/pThr/pTyr-binding forkhead associated (FHA) protein
MDDVNRPDEVDGPSAPLPVELPPDFFPLRLLLQPSGLTIELDRADMLIGRHTGVDVRLPLPDVSRRHCRFAFAHGRWQVVDLDSLNGVWVNGRRISQAFLEAGDTLRIGGFHFNVDLSKSVAAEQPSVIRSIFPMTTPPRRKAS